MYTYRTTTYTTANVDTAALGAALGIYSVVVLVIAVIMIASLWKIFKKAGKPGWASIIPFYNLYTFFEVAGMNGWMFLLTFIPLVNIVVLVMAYLSFAKAFGKTAGYAVGLIFLSIIFFPMLAFGKAEYVGAGDSKSVKK